MKKCKVGIIGFFATGLSKAGGQEAKTCAISRAICEKYGENNVFKVDTTGWKKNPFRLLCGLIKLVIYCENIIILPAQNSLKIFVHILIPLNLVFHRKIFYSVIGGWLPDYIKNKNLLIKKLKKLTCIFVETVSMKKNLSLRGINNVEVVPNFKYLSLNSNQERKSHEIPLKLCTFSRVMKEKGIEDIVDVVKKINKSHNICVLTLDIYGKIDDSYVDTFNDLCMSFPSYINYVGMVEPDESVDIIKNYSVLVFPTRYYTEGIPGTIVDAYMAGVPVITSLWGNYEEVFIDGITGYGYEFNNVGDLENILKKLLLNPSVLDQMNINCLNEAKKYLPENAMKTIFKMIEG